MHRLLAVTLSLVASAVADERFTDVVAPAVREHCVHCHGGDKPSGDVNLAAVTSTKGLLANPALIERMRDAVQTGAMPPDDEEPLEATLRTRLSAALTGLLVEATADAPRPRVPIRRLNRLQYNNVVRDLFRLNRDVFPLPEKLMTRFGNHLTGRETMPDRVEAACFALSPPAGLTGVRAFPKDLRASHGFDNQANQLTLSPLLLDAFLRLADSIVESPDFTPGNVGVWNELFAAPPADADVPTVLDERLGRFLARAFRRPVDATVRERYVRYALVRIERGATFTEAVRKTVSAALCSPRFLYRTSAGDAGEREYELAENLSFLLWGSLPDDRLFDLAERGELSKPDVLRGEVERMFADPRVERFLDAFPAQWMQLEGTLAATPDPAMARWFSLDGDRPASTQMVLEPLLLFDAVFVENRPVVELVSPTFGYRSAFLRDWYESDLRPPPVDVAAIRAQNGRNDIRRRELGTAIETGRKRIEELVGPVRQRLLEAKGRGGAKPVDLRPYAAWEFDGDLKASVGDFDLTPHGKVRFEDGHVVLERTHLLSKPLPRDLRTKSLEVWFRLGNLDQRGGGVMGIQGPGDFFDTIVIGERRNRHWISGSNGFSRTDDFAESTPEDRVDEPIHLVMTYAEDGTITLYRDGVPYGKPFRKGPATFPKDRTRVIFGLRHLPPGGNKWLNVSIDRARLYDRTLTAEEAQASFAGSSSYIAPEELRAALTDEQRDRHDGLRSTLAEAEAALAKVPANRDPAAVVRDNDRRFDDQLRAKLRSRVFERVELTDPRYGGIITNAAMLSMTSGPKRTHPIARGAWVIEVVLNDPPAPPPNDVPALNEESDAHLTIREKFARHREDASCAGCHTKLDPLGFALENFDIVGRWRDEYSNGRRVDPSGTLVGRRSFDGVVAFKKSIATDERRFARAFTRHLLRFAAARELVPSDAVAVDRMLDATAEDRFRLRSLIAEVVLSDAFRGTE